MSWFKGRDTPDPAIVPTRALDTTFAPDAGKWVEVFYSIQLVVAAGQTSSVELRIGAATPPTVPWGRVSLSVTGAGDSDTITAQLSGYAAPGENVRLVSAGTGTPTIVTQIEIAVA
jgi:hypothetical protein